jgi:hypothetical protein
MNFEVRSRSAAVANIMSQLPPPSLAKRAVASEGAESKRTRIWDLHNNLHCSIIGTCLSSAELRQILGRIGLSRPDLTDHELHIEGVRIAARHDAIGKILHKALDQRHKLSIRRSASLSDSEALQRHWQEGIRQGEIPGTYWAVLTHPAATDAVIKRAFGDVHMLSHLVARPTAPTSSDCANWKPRRPSWKKNCSVSRSSCATLSSRARRRFVIFARPSSRGSRRRRAI